MQTSNIDKQLLPNHVVIIPDGNRRWANEREQEPWQGHEEGAKNTENLIRKAREIGIRELSFWGSSLENLSKRPLRESQALLRIYETYFKKVLESDEIHRDQVRIRFIGRWEEQFPETLKSVLYKVMDATKEYSRYFLNFFLAYSGDDEMKEAIHKISMSLKPGDTVTDDTIKRNLMTRDMPPVDFLLRTGGEPHLSAGFMMWDLANAQLYFSEKLYPDFGPEAFEAAIADYVSRGRRFGK